jgi:macrolide transport system ATP-binding/permease protein
MLLLEAGNIKKYYADRLIIELEDFKIYTGDRIGVVGLNGSGKTTLLDMLAGRLEPDEGYVRHYCGIGYIRQFEEEGTGERLHRDGAGTVDGIGTAEETKTGADAHFHMEDGTAAGRNKLLKEFDLTQKLERDVLSGGEHTRLKIANAFSRDNILLFADEPTSNLDYKGIGLLRQKLAGLDSFVLISHDRSLLDSLCNRIVEVRDGKVRLFNGNFSFYRHRCEEEKERAALEYEKYVEAKGNLEAAISDRKRRSKKVLKTPKRMGNSEARLHRRQAHEIQEKLDNAAKSLVTRLEKLEVKEKPRETPGIRLDFSLTNPPENKVVLSAEKLSFGYDRVTVFTNAAFKVYNGKKTALWGENGTGKTTLLNLIASGSGPNPGISIVPKARLAYFRQGFENLDPDQTVLQNVMKDSVQRETTARTILARLLIQGDAVHKKVSVLSGGERIKTAFAKMFVSGANILLLDEPTNYLDMHSIEALESVLKEYEGTVLFVSHDKAFVNAVADRLLVLKNHSIQDFDGKLEEYEATAPSGGFPGNGSGIASGTVPGAASGIPENRALSDLERTMLQMRLTQTIAKLSASNGDKEALEEEYRQLVELLRR